MQCVPTALKQLILDKTEGTPFFMEEVVQTCRKGVLAGERGHYRLHASRPSCIFPRPSKASSPPASTASPPEEKALLQQLAVIGREFPLSLVRQVITQPEDELYRLLSSLQHKEFLYEQPAFPEVEYIFKHALTQEVAYNSVLQERRKALHERTAQAIEALYRHTSTSTTVSWHITTVAAATRQKAVEYLHLAGQQAVQRSANVEAITHLTTALELLKTLPDTPSAPSKNSRLQITLGTPLIATKGYAAPEVETPTPGPESYVSRSARPRSSSPVLWGLWVFYIVRAELQAAQELAEQLLRLAQSAQDPALLVQAHLALGKTLFWLGEFVSARDTSRAGHCPL